MEGTGGAKEGARRGRSQPTPTPPPSLLPSHGDLKPSNILLKAAAGDARGFVVKLADFGLSRLIDVSVQTHVSTQTYGTVGYQPPEVGMEGVWGWRAGVSAGARRPAPLLSCLQVLATGHLSPAADTYAFALIAAELATGEKPFLGLAIGKRGEERGRGAVRAFVRLAPTPSPPPLFLIRSNRVQRHLSGLPPRPAALAPARLCRPRPPLLGGRPGRPPLHGGRPGGVAGPATGRARGARGGPWRRRRLTGAPVFWGPPHAPPPFLYDAGGA